MSNFNKIKNNNFSKNDKYTCGIIALSIFKKERKSAMFFASLWIAF